MYRLFSTSMDHIQFSETNSLTLAMYKAQSFAINMRVRTIVLTPSVRTITFSKKVML